MDDATDSAKARKTVATVRRKVTTLEFVGLRVIDPPRSLRGVAYMAETIPRALAPSVPQWGADRAPRGATATRCSPVRSSSLPSLLASRLPKPTRRSCRDAGAWRARQRSAPRDRSGVPRDDRTTAGTLGMAAATPTLTMSTTPSGRSERTPSGGFSGSRTRPRPQSHGPEQPPPLVMKGEDPERHYCVAAAAYAVLATDHGNRVTSVEPDLVICP
jgi:hypothetical protein